ncbi:MAG: segregation/condensation protein A, partial [Clostridia bacterium]
MNEVVDTNEVDLEKSLFETDQLEISLAGFNGPLDLLLHLVKEAKIEIKDIFVSQVTEQFMAYMSGLLTLDVDKAGEYMEIAATLLEIKSRALLPVMPGIDEYEESPDKIFIRQLEEYKLLKEAG